MTDSDLIIEGTTATWTMHQMQGLINGSYNGTFKFKCFLNPLESIASGKEYRQLLGEYAIQATEHDGFMAFALTQLKYRVTSAPPFWLSQQGELPGGSVPDDNIVLAVLDAATRAEKLFKEQMLKERNMVLDQTILSAEKMLQKEEE